MKRALKQALLTLLLLTLVVVPFTACGGTGAGSTAAQSQPAASAPATATEAPAEGEAPEEVANVNPTGFPIVVEPITLRVFGRRDQNQAPWSEVLTLQEYEKMTNIQMDYQEVPAQGYEEKKNLLFASNDLPDIILRGDITKNEITMYGPESGQIIPLDSLLARHGENLSKILAANPETEQSLQAYDGSIYTIPELNFSDSGRIGLKQWINHEWLAAVGMEAPTTTEEMKVVLIAFRDQDPNGNGEADEIPLGIREPSSVYALGGSFGLQHQMEEPVNIDENGNLHFWLKDTEYKEYLQFLNELYTEKLLWQDYYKNDRPLWRSNLANALFGAMYMPYTDVFLDVEGQFVGYDPLVGPHGDKIWSDTNNGITNIGAFAITAACEHPEAAIRWVDYFYGAEGSMFFAYGIEGKTYTLDSAGQATFMDEILNDEQGFMTALGKINLVPGGQNPRLIDNRTDGVVATELTRQVAKDLVPFLPAKVYGKPAFNETDSNRVNAITQDLTLYRDEAATNFILGEWDFSMWDEYCKTLDKIGLPELEEIYQNALSAQTQA